MDTLERIAALEAEVAALKNTLETLERDKLRAQLAQSWQPIEFEEFLCRCGSTECENWMLVDQPTGYAELTITTESGTGDAITLPPDVRLCRLIRN